MHIHPSVKIHPTAKIDCEYLSIDEGGVVGPHCVIEGTAVHIGKELWMDEGALIGGGSCHSAQSELIASDFLHMGRNSQINIARRVLIGEEVGIGIETKIFTHGAYLSELAGFPVEFANVRIGSRVWLPNAWVNPGVDIGSNTVVAARSLINKSLPEGCLAGGVPAKVLKENCYPRQLDNSQRAEVLLRICDIVNADARADVAHLDVGGKIVVLQDPYQTIFFPAADLCSSYIQGPVNTYTELVRNQLRRHGIRFRFSVQGGEYTPW